jgi:phage gp45-like
LAETAELGAAYKMQRNSLTDMSARAMHQAVRLKLGKLGKINDNPMMQELDFSGMFADGRKLVERVQAFGFSSVPMPVKGGGGQGGSQGGQGGIGSQSVGPSTQAAGGDGGGGGGGDGGGGGQEEEAAEGVALFMGGQRNHPVVVAVDDRRYRPMGLKPGENSQYDDIGQMTLMRRNGLYLLSTDGEDGEGKKSDRMVSLRHVEKTKQERKPQVQQKSRYELEAMTVQQRRAHAQALAQQAKDDQAKQDHKHEGESVNTELRVTKKKIEFYNGDQQVGEHDKASQKWNMKGKEFNATPSDASNINSKQVNINGSTGIAMSGPTTINGSPAATMGTLQSHFDLVAALEARIAALEARLGP